MVAICPTWQLRGTVHTPAMMQCDMAWAMWITHVIITINVCYYRSAPGLQIRIAFLSVSVFLSIFSHVFLSNELTGFNSTALSP